jgi:hypothetical protein
MVGAARNDYFWGARRYRHHKIYREKQPRLYWFNFVFMAAFFVLGLLLLAWSALSPSTFHRLTLMP